VPSTTPRQQSGGGFFAACPVSMPTSPIRVSEGDLDGRELMRPWRRDGTRGQQLTREHARASVIRCEDAKRHVGCAVRCRTPVGQDRNPTVPDRLGAGVGQGMVEEHRKEAFSDIYWDQLHSIQASTSEPLVRVHRAWYIARDHLFEWLGSPALGRKTKASLVSPNAGSVTNSVMVNESGAAAALP
jgi:hypothetical protein